MRHEAVLARLSDGRQPNGMIVRLQGPIAASLGIHTHNMLNTRPSRRLLSNAETGYAACGTR